MNNVAIIIPVRLASTRLPNKPLAIICGKSMIQRVYEKAIETNIKNIFIACDGKEIADEVQKFGGEYIITDPNLPSGTDRIYQAYSKLKEKGRDFEYIVNLQGDLPNIDPEAIKSAINTIIYNNCDIATLASKIKNQKEIIDPNVVKIAIAFKEQNLGQALYFSRSAIPFCKKEPEYYHHIGIYAYKKQALEQFVKLTPSKLEQQESLEQLRALENNLKIYVSIVDSNPLSVDTKEDLQDIIKIIKPKSVNRKLI